METQVEILINKLSALYADKGIYENNLSTSCKHCNSCWGGIEHRISGYGIAYPWIGELYAEKRLLFYGINMNDCGDSDSQIDIVTIVKKELSEGKRKFLISENYAGTMYWKMVAEYAKALVKFLSPDNFEISLEQALDYISITNAIKCSPQGDRSKPTDEMWRNCLSFILLDEIEALSPSWVVILGLENYSKFKLSISDFETIQEYYSFSNDIFIGNCSINGKLTNYLAIIHPTAPRGNMNLLPSLLDFTLRNFQIMENFYLKLNNFMAKNKLEFDIDKNIYEANEDSERGFRIRIGTLADKNLEVAFVFNSQFYSKLYWGIHVIDDKLQVDSIFLNTLKKNLESNWGPSQDSTILYPIGWYWENITFKDLADDDFFHELNRKISSIPSF
jgi:hypothetical protein